jgi:hypothetical protein
VRLLHCQFTAVFFPYVYHTLSLIPSYRQHPCFALWGHWLRICPEGVSGFLQYLHTTIGGSALKLGHDRFLLHPFRFIIHYHPIIPCYTHIASATDSVFNIPKMNQLSSFMFVFAFLSLLPPSPLYTIHYLPLCLCSFGLLLSPRSHFLLFSLSATVPNNGPPRTG